LSVPAGRSRVCGSNGSGHLACTCGGVRFRRLRRAASAPRRARRDHHHGPNGLPQPRRAARRWCLVVGASASGIQIAEELHRSGRPVTLTVGEHVRMPRTYRGMDILWWMDASGLLDERYNEIPDLVRARRLPSMRLVGSPERKTLNLNVLRRFGVRLVGRLAGIRDGAAQFSGSLANLST
jgi:putative flavoprotein involved in K+ transport